MIYLTIVVIILIVWNVWLTLKLLETRAISARVFDIHTDALQRHESALKPAEYPKYLGDVIECESPEIADMGWSSVRAVSAYPELPVDSVNYQRPRRAVPPVPMSDPESAPFFTESAPEK